MIVSENDDVSDTPSWSNKIAKFPTDGRPNPTPGPNLHPVDPLKRSGKFPNNFYTLQTYLSKFAEIPMSIRIL